MNTHLILYPMAAMVLLVCVVAALMLRARVVEMKQHRIHPQKVATRAQSSAMLSDTRAADNYQNLFEMPVLFYALCLALYMTQLLSLPMLAGAWLYVALRCLHSYIHITYNTVMHRFQVFALSGALLAIMWLTLTAQLLMRS